MPCLPKAGNANRWADTPTGENMKEILKQLEGLIALVVDMKVNEDTDVLLAELNDIHVKLSAQQSVEPTPLGEAEMLAILNESKSEPTA
jgi:hypothetical protein